MKKIFIAVLLTGIVVFALGTVVFARPWQPRLPVDVSYRTARLDASLVAQIHNESDTVRKVLVFIQSPTTGQTVRKVEVIPGRSMIEIGWLEGWRFVSGEQLRIHQSGFKDYAEVVP